MHTKVSFEVTRERAIEALRLTEGNLVDAILNITTANADAEEPSQSVPILFFANKFKKGFSISDLLVVGELFCHNIRVKKRSWLQPTKNIYIRKFD